LVLPPKPSQTDGATRADAGFGGGFCSFFAPAKPSQTGGEIGAGVVFGTDFFFRVALFILFLVRTGTLCFAFLDFFPMFNLPMVMKKDASAFLASRVLGGSTLSWEPRLDREVLPLWKIC
jgi:hypothetical protein